MALVGFCLLIGLTIVWLLSVLIRLPERITGCFVVEAGDVFPPTELIILLVLAELIRLLLPDAGDFLFEVTVGCALLIFEVLPELITITERPFLALELCFGELLIMVELPVIDEVVVLEDTLLLWWTLRVLFIFGLFFRDVFEFLTFVVDFVAFETTAAFRLFLRACDCLTFGAEDLFTF